VAIGLVTYKRLEEALRTIESTCMNLIYPKELIKWFISDDGSGEEYVNELTKKLDEWRFGYWLRSGRIRKEGHEESYFCGKGWNMALGNAHQYSDFVLWLEDDWILDEPLNLSLYVKLLQKREDVGAVSFRILSIETDVRTKGFDGRMYVQYLRTSQYAYSGNPILRHGRFVKHYGWFDEETNPGGIELAYDDKYRLDEKDGPTIWRPLDISPWGAWKHVGEFKTWK
jgi:hypothetical protein